MDLYKNKTGIAFGCGQYYSHVIEGNFTPSNNVLAIFQGDRRRGIMEDYLEDEIYTRYAVE